MILAIDIGNTHTTIGFFRGERLVFKERLKSDRTFSQRTLWRKLHSILKRENISAGIITGSVISSVVPQLTKTYSAILNQHLRFSPLVINGTLELGMRILYKNPKSLGADRICNAVAAFHRYGGPVIIVDLGTATTYDVVSKNGSFLGGAIAPGIGTSADAIHQQTAQLPRIPLKFPASEIATTTVSGLQSGIMFGAIDAMEGMIRRIKRKTGASSKIILTGGLSPLISQRTSLRHSLEPSLVLYGAMLIFKRHAGRKRH